MFTIMIEILNNALATMESLFLIILLFLLRISQDTIFKANKLIN